MTDRNPVIAREIFCTKNDKLIISKVMKLKGFDWASKELSRKRYEKFSSLSYSSNCIRITSESLPEVFGAINDYSEILGINAPVAYLQRSSFPKAFCVGETDPILIVTTELIKLLLPEEQRVMVAQALVHIHSNHLKSYMIQDLIHTASDNFGVFKSIVALPRMLLEEWAVEAELTADRGMLVLIKDLDLILSAYGKLATGGVGEYSVESLLKDYSEFERIDSDTPVCPVFRTWSDLYHGNERYVFRVGKLKAFSESEEYERWSSGDYTASGVDDEEEFDDSDFYNEFGVRGDVWEAEDVHEKIAWGLPDTKATAAFLRIHLGDIFKLGVDGARDLTAEMVAGISSFFSSGSKK